MLRGLACPLGVGLGAIAREDVVRAQVHEHGAGVSATLSEALHRSGVHLEGAVLLALAHLDVVEGGAVEDDSRPHVERGSHRRFVGDVELRAAGADERAFSEQRRGPKPAAHRHR